MLCATTKNAANLRILIADDEASIVMLVRSELELAGYDVFSAENGVDAVTLAEKYAPDLVVLDIMMPSRDGFAVCQAIREFSNVPIIVLSARGQEHDKIQALNLGADDYMTKPFSVGELMARVKAAMRRSQRGDVLPEQVSMRSGQLVIDLASQTVMIEDRIVKLTATEYKLLCMLVKNPGKTLLHDAILTAVWGPEYVGQVEYLWVYVGRLRRKLEIHLDKPPMLVSVPGIGYRFEPDRLGVISAR
jgi:two-component system KDP operon response regulator KdpE